VVGGPYQDETAALASVGGRFRRRGLGAWLRRPATGSMRQCLCIAAGLGGSRQRLSLRRPGHGFEYGRRNVRFTLTTRPRSLLRLHQQECGPEHAVVMGGRVREVANIQSAIRTPARLRQLQRGRSCDPVECCAPARCPPRELSRDRTVGASLGADSIRQGVTAAVGALGGDDLHADLLSRLGYQRRPGADHELVILLGFMGVSARR